MFLFKWRTLDANVSKFVTINMKYEIWVSIVKNKKKRRNVKKHRVQNDRAKTNFINHVKAIDDTICTSSEFRESYPVAGRKITWRSAKMRFLHAWLLRNCRHITPSKYNIHGVPLKITISMWTNIIIFKKKKKKNGQRIK